MPMILHQPQAHANYDNYTFVQAIGVEVRAALQQKSLNCYPEWSVGRAAVLKGTSNSTVFSSVSPAGLRLAMSNVSSILSTACCRGDAGAVQIAALSGRLFWHGMGGEIIHR